MERQRFRNNLRDFILFVALLIIVTLGAAVIINRSDIRANKERSMENQRQLLQIISRYSLDSVIKSKQTQSLTHQTPPKP